MTYYCCMYKRPLFLCDMHFLVFPLLLLSAMYRIMNSHCALTLCEWSLFMNWRLVLYSISCYIIGTCLVSFMKKDLAPFASSPIVEQASIKLFFYQHFRCVIDIVRLYVGLYKLSFCGQVIMPGRYTNIYQLYRW